jgi:hypothetical protein
MTFTLEEFRKMEKALRAEPPHMPQLLMMMVTPCGSAAVRRARGAGAITRFRNAETARRSMTLTGMPSLASHHPV